MTSPHQPLSPLTMSILVALAKGELHGYALMQEIEAQTDGALRPGTGSLYAALERLLDEGLVIESPRQPLAGEDARRKYFRVTAAGRTAARAEAERMVRVLKEARASSLIRDLPRFGEAR